MYTSFVFLLDKKILMILIHILQVLFRWQKQPWMTYEVLKDMTTYTAVAIVSWRDL